MTAAELIERLQKYPPHTEVRVAMASVLVEDEAGETEFQVDQLRQAQPLVDVTYEGLFVGLYA